jgi:hypothetical protein
MSGDLIQLAGCSNDAAAAALDRGERLLRV